MREREREWGGADLILDVKGEHKRRRRRRKVISPSVWHQSRLDTASDADAYSCYL
jgi:hypothetical protein